MKSEMARQEMKHKKQWDDLKSLNLANERELEQIQAKLSAAFDDISKQVHLTQYSLHRMRRGRCCWNKNLRKLNNTIKVTSKNSPTGSQTCNPGNRVWRTSFRRRGSAKKISTALRLADQREMGWCRQRQITL
ncbi:hypothetical protein EB796_002564 [Bugula neritina]|uniref:Uncharacterized protein n=1 Tax=Bugula neritina TaxID=10212 RepID=A0A7J7KL82_BUGNE|nr:hypothetical protein EB796_002564 [Bugula neritina]